MSIHLNLYPRAPETWAILDAQERQCCELEQHRFPSLEVTNICHIFEEGKKKQKEKAPKRSCLVESKLGFEREYPTVGSVQSLYISNFISSAVKQEVDSL